MYPVHAQWELSGLSDLCFNGCEITVHLFAGVSVYRGHRTTFGESVLSFYLMGSGAQAQPLRLVGRPYLLSHLAGLKLALNNQFIFRHTPFPVHSLRAGARLRPFYRAVFGHDTFM